MSRRDAGLTETQLAEAMARSARSSRASKAEGALRFAEFMMLARVLKVTPEAMLAPVIKW